jgi:hypothetical protein
MDVRPHKYTCLPEVLHMAQFSNKSRAAKCGTAWYGFDSRLHPVDVDYSVI